MEFIMKKITLVTITALCLTSLAAIPANANDGSSYHATHESGVKVYRGTPNGINHQAAAQYKALELRETQIDNQNRQAQAQLRSQNSIAQQRIDLDRRIAFTDNEIFSQNNNRFGGQRFNSRGFNRGFRGRFNRGFNRGISNRFYGVNGISNNSRFSGGFSRSGRRID